MTVAAGPLAGGSRCPHRIHRRDAGSIGAVESLEQRVRELTAHAVARDPGVLGAATGGPPLKGSQREVNRIVMSALSGIHQALIEIAKEIDAIRSEPSGVDRNRRRRRTATTSGFGPSARRNPTLWSL